MKGNQLKKQQTAPRYESESENVSREWLIRSAMRGGKEALQELCKAIAHEVLFSTSRIMNNRCDAEDAAQEVLIRICNGIRDLHDPKAFDAWLGRITTNEARRIMMKNCKNNNIVSITDLIDVIEEEHEDFLPYNCAIREDDRRQVLEIVDRLPERQREAVTLHYYIGLSVTETAEAMDVRHQVVSRYLKIAREKIKDELAQQEGGAWASVRGLTFLPVGALLAEALHQEAGVFAAANSIWAQQALTGCSMLAGGAAKGTTVGAVFAKTAASVAIAGSLAFGTWIGISNADLREGGPPLPRVVQTSDYMVVFSGGEAVATQINPKEAVAYADTDCGEMTALSWRITSSKRDESLYSGEGGVVTEELELLRENGEEGDYIIFFSMEDINGDTYTLSRVFTIK